MDNQVLTKEPSQVKYKDILSKLLAMKDFNAFLEKYRKNFLTSRQSIPSIPTFQISITERLLAGIYGNVNSYLPYISTFCQIFESLDWETAAFLYNQKLEEEIVDLESSNNVINERARDDDNETNESQE